MRQSDITLFDMSLGCVAWVCHSAGGRLKFALIMDRECEAGVTSHSLLCHVAVSLKWGQAEVQGDQGQAV
jgi:hypothetical protein